MKNLLAEHKRMMKHIFSHGVRQYGSYKSKADKDCDAVWHDTRQDIYKKKRNVKR